MRPGVPIYQLEGVVQCYGGQEIVRVEELSILRGEIFGLVGPSGAGKSTFLRLLNFLEAPVEGNISLQGNYSPNGSDKVPLEVRRQVTMVFQRPVLLRGSVFDNVAYGLQVRNEEQIEERVREVLGRVGLEDFMGREVRSLSGGEAQRVALARALVIRPEILLLDEPTANLDPYNVALIEGIIESYNGHEGKTVVLVTHSVFQARRLAHRAGLMLGGKIVEVGEKERFFNAPQDPRTASFVRGEMIY